MARPDRPYDCVVAGAGPGGLQAAIYLGRFNRMAVVLDRGGGRTRHAVHIENYLGHRLISGRELLDTAASQARAFGVEVKKEPVRKILKEEGLFRIHTDVRVYTSRFAIVSSGGNDNLPRVENLHKFFAKSFYTCVDCDGHLTTRKKLILMGNSFATVRLAFAMKQMFTDDITLLLLMYEPPEDYKELLKEEGIRLIKGRPRKLLGEEDLQGLELQDGTVIKCECIMSNFGFKLNDDFLGELDLKRDSKGFKYIVNHNYESSLSGLYIVGPLNPAVGQVVIAAAQGALAALDINKRLLEM